MSKVIPTATIATIVIIAIVVLYYKFDPSNSVFAPKCPFFLLTGYQCPSCGIQRAMHALLNGEFKTALLLNPFLAIGVPYCILLLFTATIKKKPFESLQKVLHHRYIIWGYIVLFFIWWVVRNTSWWYGISS